METQSKREIAERLKLAVSVAQEAGELTLQYLRRSGLKVEFKGDQTPVTIADRAAEELLRKRISQSAEVMVCRCEQRTATS